MESPPAQQHSPEFRLRSRDVSWPQTVVANENWRGTDRGELLSRKRANGSSGGGRQTERSGDEPSRGGVRVCVYAGALLAKGTNKVQKTA